MIINNRFPPVHCLVKVAAEINLLGDGLNNSHLNMWLLLSEILSSVVHSFVLFHKIVNVLY